jgi:hypothetical protein
MNKVEKIVDKIIKLGEYTGSTLVAGATALQLATPAQVVLLTGVLGVVSIFRDLAFKRTSEFFQQFIDNKKDILQEITNSEEFQAIFLELLNEHVTESNEIKRKLIRNYILNIAKGVEPNFNEHSRVINILNTISFEEIDMLKLWDEDGVVDRWAKEEPNSSRDTFAQDVHNLEYISRGKNTGQIIFNRQNQEKNNRLLISLGNKDLLYVLSADNFGSGVEAKAKCLTEFGKTFLAFIKS